METEYGPVADVLAAVSGGDGKCGNGVRIPGLGYSDHSLSVPAGETAEFRINCRDGWTDAEAVFCFVPRFPAGGDRLRVEAAVDGCSLGVFDLKRDFVSEEWKTDILRNQKCSYIQFDSYVEEAKADGSFTFDDMMAMVEEYFGLVAPGETAVNEALVMNDYEYAKLQKAYADDQSGNVDGYEESLLYGGYSPISVTLTHILNNKAGIGWTSYAHTGLPVPVYAYGEGAELFVGAYDNTEVAHKLMDLTDAR